MIIGISGKIGGGKDTIGKIIQVICHIEKMKIPFSMAAFNYNLEKHFSGNTYYGEWKVKRFAGKLKEIVSLLTGIAVEDLEKEETKSAQLTREWWNYKALDTGTPAKPLFKNYPAYATEEIVKELGENRINKPTYRDMLQKVGTECMRDLIHENVWINALFADYKDKFVVTTHESLTVSAMDKFPKWIITDCRFPNEAAAIKKYHGIIIRVNRTMTFAGTPEEWKNSKHNHPSETALDKYTFDYNISNDGTIEDLVNNVREILLKEKIIQQ